MQDLLEIADIYFTGETAERIRTLASENPEACTSFVKDCVTNHSQHGLGWMDASWILGELPN